MQAYIVTQEPKLIAPCEQEVHTFLQCLILHMQNDQSPSFCLQGVMKPIYSRKQGSTNPTGAPIY